MLPLLAPSPRPAAPLLPSMLPAAAVSALYIHVPFCFHKCHYCDFYSITRQTPDRMARFVQLLLNEADLWASGLILPFAPQTIFIGGGTPSLLPIEMMDRLLLGLRQRFDLSSASEWTVECNPATVAADYCQMLRSHGINRLSFGAQSFDPAELKTLERHHTPDDVTRSIDLARAAGFTRLNLDLIFAVPGQTLGSWHRSLDAALAIGTTHLSCYALTFEPNTPLAVRRRLGQLQSLPDDLELQMLFETRDRLTSINILPYEISNFAAANEACRHNVNYWTGGNYIGLGPSAASHVDGLRWKNHPHLGEWESAIESGALPAAEVEKLAPRQRAGELAMLMLRLQAGLDLDLCTTRTGIDAQLTFAPAIDRLTQLGLIELSDHHVRLTTQGISVADAVAGEFVEDDIS